MKCATFLMQLSFWDTVYTMLFFLSHSFAIYIIVYLLNMLTIKFEILVRTDDLLIRIDILVMDQQFPCTEFITFSLFCR